MAAGVADLRAVVQWLLAGADDPRLAAAAANSYLQLAGVVCGGWMMAESAVKSAAALAAGGGEADFYHAKLAAAKFYAAQILPQTSALAHTIMHGSDAIVDLDLAHFLNVEADL